ETLPWNLELPEVQAAQDKQIPWQEIDMSIGEIGSDFTVQGIDLNYVGVILGSSIIWNEETNSLDIDADKSCDHQKIRKINGSYDNEENRKYLKNVVNVLLTRGVHGLYIYAVDEELRRKLRDLNKKL
ncbi:DNA/RNA helicase domain-containing protein, partial [Weissella paramesenteroides]